MITEKCPLCFGTNICATILLKEGQSIWVCQNCSNAFTFPDPAGISYDNHSFFELVASDENRWRTYSTQISDFIQRNYGTSGRLLDVGCSHGLLLEESRKLGFDSEGIEPSESAIAYCHRRGLNVRHGYLMEGIYPPGTFDVVVMSHVLEHLAQPEELLEAVRSVLAKAGVLCLSQTNYQSTLARWLGRRWGGWAAKEHYYHFSKKGITWLLQKAGFEVLTVELLSLGYTLSISFESPRAIVGTAFNVFQYIISRYQIGFPFQGDQMYVLARPVS